MRKALLLLAVLFAVSCCAAGAQEKPAGAAKPMHCDGKHEGDCKEHCAKMAAGQGAGMHHGHDATHGPSHADHEHGAKPGQMKCGAMDMKDCRQHCAQMSEGHAAEVHHGPGAGHHATDGFMRHGMTHETQKNVKLEEKIDDSARLITLREGGMNLPAHSAHDKTPQPPDQIWTVPFDGWLLGFTPRMMDSTGAAVPGKLLHHTAFWNTNRSDFLCRNKEEHIFGAGSEMNVWPAVPGFGYRVQKGDQIRIETMVYNPTGKDYSNVWLQVDIQYLPQPAGAEKAAIRNAYPAWIDVQECGNSGYTLLAGKSSKTGVISVPYNGVLLGVGGHLHDYATNLSLREAASGQIIASLDAKTDEKGALLSIPVATFYEAGGFALKAGDKLEVTASYDNPTAEEIPDGAMGIVVGYFVPEGEAGIASLRRIKKPIDKKAKP